MGACQDSACAVGQITFRSSPRPAPDKRDASRSSRTFGAGCDGRVWRIRRMRRMRTEKLWRPDASTLASSRQGNPAGDGGKKARSPGRPQRKPLKPSRRECRIVSANLWWLTRVLFTFAHEAAGKPNARHSLRPLFFRGTPFCKTRVHHAAGMQPPVREAGWNLRTGRRLESLQTIRSSRRR